MEFLTDGFLQERWLSWCQRTILYSYLKFRLNKISKHCSRREHFQTNKPYIVNTVPVESPFLGLYGTVAEEVVVLGAPHPEVLHEHDGVAPLLVRVAPEEGGQVGQVDGVLQEMACWSWRSFYVINTTREQEQPPGGIGPNSLLDGLARVSHTIEYFSMHVYNL